MPKYITCIRQTHAKISHMYFTHIGTHIGENRQECKTIYEINK